MQVPFDSSQTEEESARASPAAKQSLSILIISDIEKRSINMTVRVFIAASLSTTVFHLRVHPVFPGRSQRGPIYHSSFGNRTETRAR